jgi:hypothetical protein
MVRSLNSLDPEGQDPAELLALDSNLPRRLLDEDRQKLHGPENPKYLVTLREIPAVRQLAVVISP